MATDPVADLQAELTDPTTGAQFYQNMGDAQATSDADAVGYYKQAAALASDAASKASARAPKDVEAANYASAASTAYAITLGLAGAASPRLTAETAASQAILAAQQAINLVRDDLTLVITGASPSQTKTTSPWVIGGLVALGAALVVGTVYYVERKPKGR